MVGIDKHTLVLIHGDEVENYGKVKTEIVNTGVTVSTSQSNLSNKSLYFNGNSKLTISNDRLSSILNGDFTIDWWEYRTNDGMSLSYSMVGDLGFYHLFYRESGTYIYSSYSGTAWDCVGIAPIPVTKNKWQHQAIVKKGNILVVYLNGKNVWGQEVSNSFIGGSNSCALGGYIHTEGGFSGYMEEFRISDVARWTSDFTPPDKPYSPEPTIYIGEKGTDEHTRLLIHGDSISDDSQYNTLIENYGATVSTDKSKFGTKSLYFNGTSKIKCNNIGIDLNKDFTFDWWECRENNGASFCYNLYSVYFPAILTKYNNNQIYISYAGSTWDAVITIPSSVSNSWQHHAIVRHGNTLMYFINGANTNSIQITSQFSKGDNNLLIGSHNDGTFVYKGYMQEFRISDVARWTSDFTPPTVPYGYEPTAPIGARRVSDMFIGKDNKSKRIVKAYLGVEGKSKLCYQDEYLQDSHTKLLIHGDKIEDSSGYHVPLTNSGVTVSTAQAKFKDKSLYFDGNSWINFPQKYVPYLDKDFTIDWWEYCTTSDTNHQSRYFSTDAGGHYNTLGLLLGHQGIQVFCGNGWNMINGANMFNVVQSQWVHWATVRSGDILYTFRNGVKFAQTPIVGSIPYDEKTLHCIGGWRYIQGQKWIGHMSEFRISDVARWTSDFAPPTRPYI